MWLRPGQLQLVLAFLLEWWNDFLIDWSFLLPYGKTQLVVKQTQNSTDWGQAHSDV